MRFVMEKVMQFCCISHSLCRIPAPRWPLPPPAGYVASPSLVPCLDQVQPRQGLHKKPQVGASLLKVNSEHPALSWKRRTEALKGGVSPAITGFREAHLPEGPHSTMLMEFLHLSAPFPSSSQAPVSTSYLKPHNAALTGVPQRGARDPRTWVASGSDCLSLLCWPILHQFHQHFTHSSSPYPLPPRNWPLLGLFTGLFTFVYGTPLSSQPPVSPTEILSQAPAAQGLIYISLTNLI